MGSDVKIDMSDNKNIGRFLIKKVETKKKVSVHISTSYLNTHLNLSKKNISNKYIVLLFSYLYVSIRNFKFDTRNIYYKYGSLCHITPVDLLKSCFFFVFHFAFDLQSYPI